jgi:long-subunit fatty acid transport protein
MKTSIAAAICATMGASGAMAGGIDRVGQRSTEILAKDGNYAELTATYTTPTVTGNDLPLSPTINTGASYDNVAGDDTTVGFGVKYSVTDRVTLAFTGSEDFGADIFYDGDPRRSNLGGTSVTADTYAFALIGEFRVTDNFSVHAGVRRDVAEGTIKLSGLAYGRFSGYEVNLSEDVGYGYLVGAAYAIPEIGFRAAITYNSVIEHDFGTTETLRGQSLGSSADTNVDTPQSVNIDLQTGIAEDTLLFGSIRWAEWSQFKIAPQQFSSTPLTQNGLVSLDDTTTYSVGVGRRFTESFAARAAFIYETGGSDDLVSPLAPTNGLMAIALGGSYRVGDVEFAGGVRYTWLGDSKPETGTPDVARANFANNDAISVGVRAGYYF